MNNDDKGLTVVLGTGGTMAGKAARAGDNVGYVAGQVSVADLLVGVPALSSYALEVEQVAQVDSKDMDLVLWQSLLRRLVHHLAREEVSGIVVTHGTDTLEETAFLVERVLRPSKPVVFTCAMRPATALVPDGPQNLLDAVQVARHPGWGGCVLVCAGRVHRAEVVNKVHTYRMDAFDSGDAGPVALVEEGALRWTHQPMIQTTWADAGVLKRVLEAQSLPRVQLITSHADADGSLVQALLTAGRADPLQRTRGVVVAATGNGTLHRRLIDALHEAQADGVRVVRATRCARGRVIPDPAHAFPDSAGLSPVKARLALALDLLG